MRVLLFGQIGLRKKLCIAKLEEYAYSHGKSLKVYNVGEMMYEITPTARPHRILQKNSDELTQIRQRVWDKIILDINNDDPSKVFLVNSHSTFRWQNGLSTGFSNKEISDLHPDMCITLIDDIQDIKYSLNLRPVKPDPFTLKDIIIWREEEIMAAEFAASLVDGCRHYVVAKNQCPELLYKLIFKPNLRKVYISYPITNIMDIPEVWTEVLKYRKELSKLFIAFDPISISEGSLKKFEDNNKKFTKIEIHPENEILKLRTAEIKEVIPNIDGQIITRDFKLIDQSDMVIAYIPEINGRPEISTGVERELSHAQSATLETYVVWKSKRAPSPFQQATKTFSDINMLFGYFK